MGFSSHCFQASVDRACHSQNGQCGRPQLLHSLQIPPPTLILSSNVRPAFRCGTNKLWRHGERHPNHHISSLVGCLVDSRSGSSPVAGNWVVRIGCVYPKRTHSSPRLHMDLSRLFFAVVFSMMRQQRNALACCLKYGEPSYPLLQICFW